MSTFPPFSAARADAAAIFLAPIMDPAAKDIESKDSAISGGASAKLVLRFPSELPGESRYALLGTPFDIDLGVVKPLPDRVIMGERGAREWSLLLSIGLTVADKKSGDRMDTSSGDETDGG